MLLAALIYSYATGVFGSRRIEGLFDKGVDPCRSNVARSG
jgi:hypothetical protein